MNTKNFLNLHILMSHSPSCLNRDDMNMQKSAIFGGTRRVRISSQSLKRAIRKSDYYQQHLGEPSVRTRELGNLRDHYIDALKDDYPAETVTKAIALIAEKDLIEDDTQAAALAPWAADEVAEICRIVNEADKDASAKQLKKAVASNLKNLRNTLNNAVDIALSGRMATSGLMTSVDGAMALAHTITTHAVDADIDWFTAVDDLIEEEGEVGAGHLNTQEFSAGVFYRYASLNLNQLQENLGGASREQALDIGRHLAHMLATVVPSAKQQTFAAHNLADVAVASFGDMPISLANAFEEPVSKPRTGGFLKPSAEKLIAYWQKLQQGYGLDDEATCFSTLDLAVDGAVDSLTELENWIANDGAHKDQD